MAKRWAELLGIEPPATFNNAGAPANITFHGVHTDANVLGAGIPCANLEILQPTDQHPSFWLDHFREFGTSTFNFGFATDLWRRQVKGRLGLRQGGQSGLMGIASKALCRWIVGRWCRRNIATCVVRCADVMCVCVRAQSRGRGWCVCGSWGMFVWKCVMEWRWLGLRRICNRGNLCAHVCRTSTPSAPIFPASVVRLNKKVTGSTTTAPAVAITTRAALTPRLV